ncbi:MAG: hypothetical protein J6Z49_01905 [Kiritimatiellae bacterium]|nr:hypothetical protein [Kiritimatiellia bacterium]
MVNVVDTECRAYFERWVEAERSRLVSLAPGYRPPGARRKDGQDGEIPKSPSREVRLLFESLTDDPRSMWRAELTVPPNSVVGTMCAVSVSGKDGHPVSDGF